MKLVGTALGDHVDDGAIVAAIFGMKLLVMTRNSWVESGFAPSTPPSTAGNGSVVVINAIQQEIIVAFARTVH